MKFSKICFPLMLLIGDTAQCIMYGISFRFAELKSIFYGAQRECELQIMDMLDWRTITGLLNSKCASHRESTSSFTTIAPTTEFSDSPPLLSTFWAPISIANAWARSEPTHRVYLRNLARPDLHRPFLRPPIRRVN